MHRDSSPTYLLSTPRLSVKLAPALYFTASGSTAEFEDSCGSSEPDSPVYLRLEEKASALSRLSIDFERFFDIIENRREHHPFEELPSGQHWLYRDEAGRDFGPHTPQQMNHMFQNDRFSDMFIFRISADEKHLTFDQLIKRYYKRQHPQMLTKMSALRYVIDPLSDAKPSRPSREALPTRHVLPRLTRIFSDQVRPSFAFLAKPDVPELESSDAEDVVETRCRSITMI